MVTRWYTDKVHYVPNLHLLPIIYHKETAAPSWFLNVSGGAWHFWSQFNIAISDASRSEIVLWLGQHFTEYLHPGEKQKCACVCAHVSARAQLSRFTSYLRYRTARELAGPQNVSAIDRSLAVTNCNVPLY